MSHSRISVELDPTGRTLRLFDKRCVDISQRPAANGPVSCEDIELFAMPSSHRDIIAIGASAGGIESIRELLRQLPANLPASILVTLHRPPDRVSHLREILARETEMHVVVPHPGERLQHGRCYLGTPDRHLAIGPGARFFELHDGFYRGHCIDALFQSLARHAGHRTIGVVLSGMLRDGTLGLKAIKECGGLAFVQSPAEACHKRSDEP